MVAATGVLVAAVYYVLNMRAMQRNSKAALETRQAQLLMNIYERWSNPEFQDAWTTILSWEWKDFDDFIQKYYSSKESKRTINLVSGLFEGLGVYVKRGFIDASLVDDLMSGTIVTYWQKLGSIAVEYRKRMNAPTNAEYQEYLYNVIYEIWKLEHPETPRPHETQTLSLVSLAARAQAET